MKIELGRCVTEGEPAFVDLDKLLRSRMLVQASSGGGKSYLLRRLAEQLVPHVPVIIIDPEGEFSTLREKFNFVLVGPGGETPADPRSAELVAHKLLELRASAVCDIYELKPYERHRWVKLFLSSMVDAPKKLWRSTIVVVDEAHVFMPEKGQGESEASGSMIDLATRGRKRGFCSIMATQRLAKLSKNGTAELQNRLIGPTYEGVDLDRAADELSIPRRDRDAWFAAMKRDREPGQFEAVGPAIGKERLLVEIGKVQTTHPEVGGKQIKSTPPTPREVKKLLPQLADLPQEAEEKAATEIELRNRVRELESQLRSAPKVVAPVISPADVAALDRALARLGSVADTLVRDQRSVTDKLIELQTGLTKVAGQLPRSNTIVTAQTPPILPVKLTSPVNGHATVTRERETIAREPTMRESNNAITRPQQKILDSLAWLHSLGIETPSWTQVGVVCGVSSRTGSFINNRSRLSASGLVEYPRAGCGRLTENGTRTAQAPDQRITLAELHARVCAILTDPQAKILRLLLDHYPHDRAVGEIAARLGISEKTGSFINNRSRLHAMEFVEYTGENKRSSERLRAAAILFPEGLS